MADRGFAADSVKNRDLEYTEPTGDVAQDPERERRRIDRGESEKADAGRRQQCPEDSRGGENVDHRQGDLGQDQHRARGLDRYRAEHHGPSARRQKTRKIVARVTIVAAEASSGSGEVPSIWLT